MPLRLPWSGSLQELSSRIPREGQVEARTKWAALVAELKNMNYNPDMTGLKDVNTDILYCSEYYAEPLFRYKEQEQFWMRKRGGLQSMAHDKRHSKEDIRLTKEFLAPLEKQLRGLRVLNVCGGQSRCYPMIAGLFEQHDVFDLKPG